MATIYYTKLNEGLVQSLQNKRYKEEEVVEIYNSLKESTKKKKTGFIVAMVILGVMMLGYGPYALISSIGLPECLPLLLFLVVITIGVGVLVWYLMIGMVKIKWNKLMKVFYPSIYENCKL